MRKLFYEPLEARALLATLATLDLPPSSVEVVESSTRNFIDSAIERMDSETDEVILQSRLSLSTTTDPGASVEVTRLVVDVGSDNQQLQTQRLVFTFTVYPNNSISLRAASILQSQREDSAFPVITDAVAKADPMYGYNFETMQIESVRNAEGVTVESDADEAPVKQAIVSPSTRADFQDVQHSSQDAPPDKPRSALHLQTSLVLAAEPPTDSSTDTAHKESEAASVREFAILSPSSRSLPPLSTRMIFLCESTEDSAGAFRRIPAALHPSAILQVFIGFSAGSPDASVEVGAIDLDQSKTERSTGGEYAVEAFVLAVGVGFALHSRRRKHVQETEQAIPNSCRDTAGSASA